MRKKTFIISFISLFLTIITAGFSFGENIETETNQYNQKEETALSDEELIKLADDLMDTVSKLRGLNFKTEVNKKVSTRDEVREMLLQEFNDEKTQEKIYGEGKMLIKMGLVPTDFDYSKFLVDLYVDQLGGYYVPEEDTMYIAKWMSPELQAPIFAHELTHALQDQYFDLKKLLEGDLENSDGNIARNSVIEGEASLIMMEYMFKDLGISIYSLPNFSLVKFKDLIPYTSDSEVLNNAPPILVETLEFPYLYGTDFLMSRVRNNGGWDKVSCLYENLPLSTEQIMHPEKYPEDGPEKLKLNNIENTLGKDWSKINTDILGEFFLNIMIREFTTRDTGNIAAQGWDGDCVTVFEKNQNILMILMTAWDSGKDGKEFFNAYNQLIEKKYEDEYIVDEIENSYKLWSSGKRYLYTGIKENRVFIIEGADEDTLYKLQKAYWN